MDDFYIEQIVAKKGSPLDAVLKGIWIGLTAVTLVGGVLFGQPILLVLGLVVGFGGNYFVLPMLKIEYEYLYMSKELSVDKILDQQKRKKAGSYSLSNMEIMARVDDYRIKDMDSRVEKTLDYSSRREDADRFAIIINDKGLTKLVIEPDERLLKAIKDQFPRKVFL